MFPIFRKFKFLIPIIAISLVVSAYFIYSVSPIHPENSSRPAIAGTKEYNFGPSNSFDLPSTASQTAILENITAKSVYVYDLTAQKALFAKNPDLKLPTASTLKILTAIVTLDNSSLENIFSVSAKAANVGEDSMLLSEGERLTVKDLLYGLMLPSGNDAAITLAENIAGDESKFVEIMNQKAQKIGMNDTFFVNTSGLEGDGEDYSTVKDMTQLAAYSWTNYPLLKTIAGTYNYQIPQSDTHKFFDLYNETNLLTTYPGVKGFKPGFTPKAGYCLITVAEINGHEIIITMLNSQNRREEMRQILDHLNLIIS